MMPETRYWYDKRVVVTGGAGFLGSYVVERLLSRGCRRVIVPRRRTCDLRDAAAIDALLRSARADLVIHLAAVVGGIGANRQHPGSFFYDNLMMGVQLMEAARRLGVGKFVAVGTICAYPKHTPVPFSEDDLWAGYPEETNAPYGLAKKMLLVQAQAYRQEYGFNAITLMPTNLFGPRDNFEPESSHVIPAILRKCLEGRDAGDPFVRLWGDGSPTREFLHADDAARAILLAAEHYDGPDPVNVGSGREISIRDLAGMLRDRTGFAGGFLWDEARPNGQPRRCLDTSRARERFGFQSTISLEEGLDQTVAWYCRKTGRSLPSLEGITTAA